MSSDDEPIRIDVERRQFNIIRHVLGEFANRLTYKADTLASQNHRDKRIVEWRKEAADIYEIIDLLEELE